MRKADGSKQEPLPSWGPSVPGVPAGLCPHHAGLCVQLGRTQCEFGPPSRGHKPHQENHRSKLRAQQSPHVAAASAVTPLHRLCTLDVTEDPQQMSSEDECDRPTGTSSGI